jgi:hypothetical protein
LANTNSVPQAGVYIVLTIQEELSVSFCCVFFIAPLRDKTYTIYMFQ